MPYIILYTKMFHFLNLQHCYPEQLSGYGIVEFATAAEAWAPGGPGLGPGLGKTWAAWTYCYVANEDPTKKTWKN